MTGETIIRLSKRSSMPPCPGIKEDESLTPKSLFNIDSNKSPACPVTPIIIPIIIELPRER